MYLPQMLRVHFWTKARVSVYSNSVLCLGKMHGPEDAIKKWNDQVSTLKMCHAFRELQGLDGEPFDLRVEDLSRATALDILHKIQADLQRKHIKPENFSARINFMSMFNDIVLEKEDHEYSSALPSRKIKEYAS